MFKKITYLTPYQNEKAKQFIQDLRFGAKQYSFGQVVEKLYAQDDVFFKESPKINIINISSGTSRVKTFIPYLNILVRDLRKHAYYREYFSPQGSASLRKSISIYENAKFGNKKIYDKDDICLTEGATGAISSFFEYFKYIYPEGEILIPTPSYYLFKLAAEHFHIKYHEVLSYQKDGKSNTIFLNIEKILNSITNKTKLIVITNPNNPTGEVYKKNDLIKIIKVAREKNMLLLSDEVFFDLILDTSHSVYTTDFIAEQFNLLKNLFTVKSLSKNRNLPGLRLGYILTKNKSAIEYFAKIQEERVFFATASNFKTILIYDNLLQSISTAKRLIPGKKQDIIISQFLKYYQDIGLFQNEKKATITKLYLQFEKYLKKVNQTYYKYFDFTISEFGGEVEEYVRKQSGFNTFIKIKDLEEVNIFDFCLNLYLHSGIKIEASPYFGLTQKQWENKKNIGFWIRFTFAQDKKIMRDGIRRFLAFKKSYLSNPDKYIRTNLQF